MQLLIMILINIAMAVVLYLVISLRLERSASEFREQKLRKEMDAIMREFNRAAERNITLLEHRIETMKRLLERSGDITSVDFTVADSVEKTEEYRKAAERDRTLPVVPETPVSAETKEEEPLKKRLLLFFQRAGSMFAVKSKGDEENRLTESPLYHETLPEGLDRSSFAVQDEEPDFMEVEKAPLPGHLEIRKRIDTADDPALEVALLYTQGVPVEELSLVSGKSLVEIQLIVNLYQGDSFR